MPKIVPDKHRMAELHEAFLAELNGGVQSKASGSQWTDPGDGRNNRMTEDFAFAWDGKSTCGETIAVSRAMIAKIREQAGGERPQLGLRFYATWRLDEVTEDWVAVPAADWAELLEAARRPASLITGPGIAPAPPPAQAVPPAVPGTPSLDWVPEGMPPRALWPCWLVEVWQQAGGGVTKRGYRISADGRMEPFPVKEVRIDSEAGPQSRVMVDDVLMRRGELRINGELRARVGIS